MLEFTQVAEIIRSGQSLLTSPVEGFVKPALRSPYCVLSLPRPGAHWVRSHLHTGVLPRRAGRAHRSGHPRPLGSAPAQPASGSGFAVIRRARPVLASLQILFGGSKSPRSRYSSLIPTSMSAVPRSAGVPCSAASCKYPLKGVHCLVKIPLRNQNIRLASVRPIASEKCPAFCSHGCPQKIPLGFLQLSTCP
jgi:hypothetical protein